MPDLRLWKHRRRDTSARTSQAEYARILKDIVAPRLRELGLRGSGRTFRLPMDDHWAMVGFQGSVSNDAAESRFTVNLAVARRDAWAARREADPALPEHPRPSIADDAEHWTRLGPLLPDGQGDKWWRILAGGDNDAVAHDVLRDLEAYGLPWLRDRAL